MASEKVKQEKEKMKRFETRRFQSVTEISGPLMFVDIKGKGGVSYGEIGEVELSTGEQRQGQVLDISEDLAIVQVFEGTTNLDTDLSSVRFIGETLKVPVSRDMLGRVFNGRGKPIDDGPEVVPKEIVDVLGAPLNPSARKYPHAFIQTGISTIDALLTLVRGQKLPLFSAAGLPHNELAAQIARQAAVLGQGEAFAVVFAALGITFEEARFFREDFERTGALENVALFLNLAEDPTVERIMTPRIALSLAEHLAFENDMHVLVIMTDITNYAESLREIGAAREEVPGRRGYPGYLYSDLSTIYERAGTIKGKQGTITQIPILTMPAGDQTHPVPDLSGYITEGQIIVDSAQHRKSIYPPINPLPSLSRLMKDAIGKDSTRSDHKELSDQLYGTYAQGRDLRNLVAVVGEESLTDEDKLYLKFADEFEKRFINQEKDENRNIFQTLDLGWELLSIFPDPKKSLNRITEETIEKFHPEFRDPNTNYDTIDM